MENKKRRLQPLYDAFESACAAYKHDAACRKGCSFCCSDAGGIHITTLEGLVIRERIAELSRPQQLTVKKKLAADMRRREQQKPSACPFLMKNRACMIYTERPFACRRIYSLQICSKNQHPMLNRQVMELGQETIDKLQELDENGYSGHLSYILHMFETPAFLNSYLAGEYDPESIMDFGKSHGIIINKVMVQGKKEKPGA